MGRPVHLKKGSSFVQGRWDWQTDEVGRSRQKERLYPFDL